MITTNQASSLSILLRLLFSIIYQSEKCIILSNLNQYNEIFLAISTNSTLQNTFVIDPPECILGCSHYVLHDPTDNEPSWINKCLLQNGDYKFKAIILLTTQNIEMYTGKAYASDSIFIYRTNKEYYTIAAFADWEVTEIIVWNKWCINTNQFVEDKHNILDFFDYKWKFATTNTAAFKYDTIIPSYQVSGDRYTEPCGSDYRTLEHFFLKYNFKVIDPLSNRSLDDDIDEVIFILDNFESHIPNVVYSYPMTGLETTFLVPKPRMYSDWLHFVKLFTPLMWFFIILTYITIGVYFWIVKKLNRYDNVPTFESVMCFFVMNGFKDIEIPRQVIPRAILGLLLILGLLYGSLFSSEIVSKMIAPSYEGLITNMDEMVKSNLKIRIDDSFRQIPEREMTDVDRIIFSPERRAIIELYDGDEMKAVPTMRSENKVFRMIHFTHIEISDAHDRIYTKYQLVDNKMIYVHLVPKLNEFMLHCKAVGLNRRWEWEFVKNVFRQVPTNDMEKYQIVFDADLIELQLTHVQVAFILLGIGLLISLVVFGKEYLMMCFQNQSMFI